MRLKGDRSNQSVQSLAKIWQLTPEEVLRITDKLVDIGFFEKRGTREQPIFWIPYLYHAALEIKDVGS
jgi:3-deoxy-D-manno-octulosonate 8-phosphate phosphatase KdsC-like HAD superfamily phosphatase